jgi:transposase
MMAMSDALTSPVADSVAPDVSASTLQAENQQLREQVAQLEHQLKQLQRMIFGTRSERHVPDNPDQLSLGEAFTADEGQLPEPEKQTITYQRGKAKKVRPEDCVSDSGLRFDASVPVKTIELPAPEIEGLSADEYEVVDVKVTHRLAMRPASYVFLRYERPVIKLRDRQALVTTAAPVGVVERSLADVSFLVGLLIDKFQYHMPLYRQHQRLEAAGITLSRATLTHLVHRACQLLKPIVDAQLDHILLSRVLAMDETPIKAGKSKKRRGRMQRGYYWPQIREFGYLPGAISKCHCTRGLSSYYPLCG